MRGCFIYILFCMVFVLNSKAQIINTYELETFASLSSGKNTPFWIVNQNWGVVPLEANNCYLRAASSYQQQLNSNWTFDVGMDLIGSNKDNYGNFWLQQLYGRLDWNICRLDIGVREDYTSFLNPKLSSGDFIHSNNARPIPQVKLSLSDFLLVPYTSGNLYIKGDFSLGRFLDGQWQEDIALPYEQNYVKKELSHNKSLYFRLGNINEKSRMQFILGMMHAVKWGGELYKYRSGGYILTNQPKGLNDFFRVMIAKEGSSSSSYADNAYVAGSQWGAYLLKYDYKLNKNNLVSFYLQHFFDDGSGMVFENYRDNLLGIEYRSHEKKWLSGAVFEYIYTKQQTGPIHHNLEMDEDHKHLKNKGNGNDNYYNNTDYISGPSHYGKSFGTPLFLSPEYNRDGSVNFQSNRIISFHLGIEGYIYSFMQYRLMMTTGQSWGRYYVPFKNVRKGVSCFLELIYNSKKNRGFDIKLSLGCDNGEFFGGNTFGGGITLSKRGTFFEK